MKRLLCYLCFFLCAILAACSGVPLRSLPRLMQLPAQLLDANPAEFMVALQIDARLSPPAGAVPQLTLQIAPRDPGAYAPVDKKLPLQLVPSSALPRDLEPAPPGRRWLVYSLPVNTQLELQQVQNTVRTAKANPNFKAGGTLSLGVEQDALAHAPPALADTRWETWLQTKRADGFFEVWSGTPAQLQKAADKAK